jgi:hypothetical protein
VSAREAGALLGRPLAVASVGVDLFADELERQGVPVERLEWRPPVPVAEGALAALVTHGMLTADANNRSVAQLQEADPLLVGVGRARDLLPGMTARTILHAGPPIEWSDMSGPLRGAVIGAALHEGIAASPDEAMRKAAAGEFEFGPCHDRGAVGPMAGVVTASMPMMVVENAAHGNRAFCTFNEGLGKVLRYGAFDDEVLRRLAWIRDVFAGVFEAAVARLAEPLSLRSLIAQALEMGDEGHNRNRAGTSLLLRELLPALVDLDVPAAEAAAAARFIGGNDHFFLNLTMPAAKCAADAASGVAGSSIVTAMARNGTEFGIRLGGTGASWFTAPSSAIDGLYFSGYGPADANPDIGDSTITETAGLGGLAMAAAPAIVQFVGGTPADALAATRSMYDICWAESDTFRIPALGFRGTPLGIDAREVTRLGRVPVVNTGIAHREAGVGQIGAGLVQPPLEAFVKAVHGLVSALDLRGAA